MTLFLACAASRAEEAGATLLYRIYLTDGLKALLEGLGGGRTELRRYRDLLRPEPAPPEDPKDFARGLLTRAGIEVIP